MNPIFSEAMSFPADFKPNNGAVVHDLPGSSIWAEGDVVYIYPKPGIDHDISMANHRFSTRNSGAGQTICPDMRYTTYKSN